MLTPQAVSLDGMRSVLVTVLIASTRLLKYLLQIFMPVMRQTGLCGIVEPRQRPRDG